MRSKIEVGPRNKKEMQEWYNKSSPWKGEYFFGNCFQGHGKTVNFYLFEINPKNIDEEIKTRELLYNAIFQDGEEGDYYWGGQNGVWENFDSETRARIVTALDAR